MNCHHNITKTKTKQTASSSIYFVDSKRAFETEDLYMHEDLIIDRDKDIRYVEVQLGIKMSSPIFNEVLQYFIQNKGDVIFEHGKTRFKISGQQHVEIYPHEQEKTDIFSGEKVIVKPYAVAVYKNDEFLELLKD